MPTRLLDWTESPLVAAFFAAFKASTVAEEEREESENIAVVILNTEPLYWLQKKSEKMAAVVNAPRHGNTFLRVQQGLFTYDPFANQHFLELGRWPTFEESLLRTGDERFLSKLVLPSEQADEVLRRLFDLGITRHSLMPNLHHAALACRYEKALFR